MDDGRDNSTITTGSWLNVKKPRNLAIVLFFYVFLVLFKVCLTSIIKINIYTLGNFEFHCRAMELLHQTRALLGMRGVG